MNLIQKAEYTDKVKLMNWLLTLKSSILKATWPPMKDPRMRDRAYSITGEISMLIERRLREIEND